MHVAELWRYPVKSLRGERLRSATVREDGIVGDRLLQVRDGDGRLITARTRPRLLELDARLDSVAGAPWDSDAAASAVRAAAGADARLAPSSEQRFDDTPLLVATDGAAAELALDWRRLRPNIVIAGVPGLAERDWPGRRLVAGGVEIEVEKLCLRCVITTFDPDTLAQDPSVLDRINRDVGGRVALNCYVARPGTVSVGDSVELR